MVAELDLLIRGAALGVMALMIVLLAAQTRRADQADRVLAGRKWLAMAVTALLAGCYLLISSPAIDTLLGAPGPWAAPAAALRLLLIIGAMLAPVGISWMVLEIFFDQPQEQGPAGDIVLALAAITVAASILAMTLPDGPVGGAAAMIRGLLALALYLSLIWLAIRTGPDDLVPARRRFRRAFVGLMALTGMIITALEITVVPTDLPPGIFPLQALAFLALAGLFSLWALGPDTPLAPRGRETTAPEIRQNPDAPIDPRDARLVADINRAMQAEIWRREGLTIAALAREIDTPEHRLRQVINGQMNYRNFSALINGYRIDAACTALTDPDRSGTTVLEIAYECGFASLGPFNRAFRAQTGQNPTEYRRDAGKNDRP